jgi:hypothetical protein
MRSFLEFWLGLVLIVGWVVLTMLAGVQMTVSLLGSEWLPALGYFVGLTFLAACGNAGWEKIKREQAKDLPSRLRRNL